MKVLKFYAFLSLSALILTVIICVLAPFSVMAFMFDPHRLSSGIAELWQDHKRRLWRTINK